MRYQTVLFCMLSACIFIMSGCSDNPGNPQVSGRITSFSFSDSANAALSQTVSATVGDTTISVTVPTGTNVTALVATFTVGAGDTVKVGSVVQQSGVTANNFTNPVTYTVVSAAGSIRHFTVTVTVESLQAAKDITSFSFLHALNLGLGSNVNGTINGTNITMSTLSGTNVTALIATFTTTGCSVTVNSVRQYSSVTANNFTSPVTYRVWALDGSSKSYTVTLSLVAATDLTQFEFLTANNPGLLLNVTAVISGTTISATVPTGTNVTTLVATFGTNGDSVRVGAIRQQSGVTHNNFTSPVTYTVYGSGTTKNYVVTVTVQPAGSNPILGTWKTAADTFTMVAETDSVRLIRTVKTTVGHIVFGGGATDTLCVLFYADSLGMMFPPYQKLDWKFLSATKIILERYGYFTTQAAALAADYINAVDTLNKQ